MFKKIRFRKKVIHIATQEKAAKHDSLRELSTLCMAAELLTAPSAFMALTLAEARVVVGYMRPQLIPEGTVFINEGDAMNTGFMALVLVGDVVVENIVVSRASPMTLTVLGPGSIHGELSLMDGLPRSASCTASSDVTCAILTRTDMLCLLADNPKIGAKLMMAMAMRTSQRLRDTTQKLKKYAQLTKAMQQEIDHLTPD